MTSPVGKLSPTEAFLMEVELANPDATGREDLIAQYFPDDTQPQAPKKQR